MTLQGTRSRRALFAGSVGNFIEWYEFGVYGSFATIIAARFFTPEGGGAVEGLVKTYASFALAFFFRPVGAALFGRLGDRIGRRPVLILVIGLMTVSTALIGALPTYAEIGALAPWLLTTLRVLQGLSSGGEFGGAVSVMTEFAHAARPPVPAPGRRAARRSTAVSARRGGPLRSACGEAAHPGRRRTRAPGGEHRPLLIVSDAGAIRITVR